jgi:hypothetical protein
VITLFAIGILLNLSQYAGFVEFEKSEKEPKRKTKLARARMRTA